MKSTSRTNRGIVGLITAVALFAMPGFAAAETASVMTKQVLPVGGSSCAPLFVSEVKTYIFDGELHSFDIVISNPSYVGLFGTAGDQTMPFNYISRRIEPNGNVRLHVDTTAAIKGSIPVTVTLLSSPTGQPTCISTISFTADAAGNVTTENPTTVPVTDTNGSGSSSSSSGGSVKGNATGGKTNPVVGTTTGTSTSISEVIAKMCTENGAYQMWFILLAIFFVIAAFVGLSQPPLAQRHGALPAVLIAIPLIGLLAFWYFVPDCRLSWFIPLILLVAAAIGVYSAYRTSPVSRALIVLPPTDTKKPEDK